MSQGRGDSSGVKIRHATLPDYHHAEEGDGGPPLRTSQSLPTDMPSHHTKSTTAAKRWITSIVATRALVRLLTPTRRLPATAPSTWMSILTIFKSSWLNLLLVFIPIGWALHFVNVPPIVVFVTTFLAIIPLAALLSFATEELAVRVGETLGGLLNATLGNVVELIVAIIALAQCKLTVVQSSLIGSILSNLLLVLGMCFFAGGVKYSQQEFLVTPSQINSELLFLSVVAVLLPGAFNFAVQSSNNSDNNPNDDVSASVLGADILKMSHGVAVILLFIYICYLVFTLWSHASVMNAPSHASTPYPTDLRGPIDMVHDIHDHWKDSHGRSKPRPRGTASSHEAVLEEVPPEHVMTDMAQTASPISDHPEPRLRRGNRDHSHQDNASVGTTLIASHVSGQNSAEQEEQTLQMNVPVTFALLIIVTILVGVTAEFLVDSIDGVTATGGISEEWVGLILLPIVGNAAEHVTAVTVAMKDKLDLSIGVAVGSSIQISIFVIPLTVVLAWIMNKPLTMLFDPFESVVLLLAVLTVNYTTQDAKSNWLEGMVLMMLYVIVAVSFWFYPGYNPSQTLNLGC